MLYVVLNQFVFEIYERILIGFRRTHEHGNLNLMKYVYFPIITTRTFRFTRTARDTFQIPNFRLVLATRVFVDCNQEQLRKNNPTTLRITMMNDRFADDF